MRIIWPALIILAWLANFMGTIFYRMMFVGPGGYPTPTPIQWVATQIALWYGSTLENADQIGVWALGASAVICILAIIWLHVAIRHQPKHSAS